MGRLCYNIVLKGGFILMLQNEAILKSNNLQGYKKTFSKDMVQRIYMLAEHVIDTHDTIRQTAQIYGYSKTLVHTDLSRRLPQVDINLYEETQKILDENFSAKHIRGGESTRKKYLERFV